MTPVRVVCNNTLNLALNTAQRAWSVRHVGDISTKLVEAQQCLEMAGKYMDALAERADQMANTTVSDERLRKILDELFPEADDMSNIQKRHVQEMKDGYMVCVMAPDLAKFRNTAWGAVNAMSDFVTHSAPHRNTKNYQANNWNNVMGGHWLIDAMTKAVAGKSKGCAIWPYGRFYEHTKVLRMVYRLGQKNGAAAMQWSPGRLCKSPRLCKQKIILGQHQAQPKARAPAEIRSSARGNQKIGG